MKLTEGQKKILASKLIKLSSFEDLLYSIKNNLEEYGIKEEFQIKEIEDLVDSIQQFQMDVSLRYIGEDEV